jgi:chromosome segregation ATPase
MTKEKDRQIEKLKKEKIELANSLNELRLEKNQLKKKIEDLSCKSKEVESYLEKYKKMMEGAINDCQTIVNREENKEKKEEYQKFEEVYKAEIEQVNNAINNLK